MKKIILALFLIILFSFPSLVLAEEKAPNIGKIPKLPQTPNDPELLEGHVYPPWGSVCTRYTYSVVYRDKEGRPPEYIRIWHNGKWIDIQKENSQDNDYKKGVRYIYQYVPNTLKANFYFFEASNGLGKARASIIDSPDNGPVLYDTPLDKNEIALIDVASGQKISSFPVGNEWIDEIAISENGQYFAAKTTRHLYFFETTNPQKPLWTYEIPFGEQGVIKGGVALSADGSIIVAGMMGKFLVFKKESNKPIWKLTGNTVLAVGVSADGKYLAGIISKPTPQQDNATTLTLWKVESPTPLWEYQSVANFHEVALSADGSFIAASTGCPDRRAYIFSKDSNQPLIRSETLTYDSPVQKVKISRDGSLAAFSTDGGPESEMLLLFGKNSSKPIWQFSESSKRASRALGMTPNGEFIVVANLNGELYLFSKEGNEPKKHWSFGTSTGALDIADNGSLIAVGGTNRKIFLIDLNQNTQKEVSLNEFVNTLDISADGKYVVAGTGASTYFFEDIIDMKRDKIYPCEKIIEPTPLQQSPIEYGPERQQQDNFGEAPFPQTQKTNLKLILIQGGVLVLVLGICYYLIIVFEQKISLTHPLLAIITLPLTIILWSINRFQFNFRQITDFCAAAFCFWTILVLLGWKLKIPKIFYILGALFLAILATITLSTYKPFFSLPTLLHLPEAVLGFGYLSTIFKDKKRIIFLGGVVIFLLLAHFYFQEKDNLFSTREPEQSPSLFKQNFSSEQEKIPSSNAVCGNTLCEPDFGETKETCPKDCSGEI